MSGAARKLLSRLQFLSSVVFPDPRKPQMHTIGILVMDMFLALKFVVKNVCGCHILLGAVYIAWQAYPPFWSNNHGQ